ncbi:MAG: hypothetical protein ABIF77_07455 [bacterium]
MNRTMHHSLILCALLVAIAIGHATAGSSADALIPFKLKDQFERLHTDARYRRSVLVVTWGDRDAKDYLVPWRTALEDSLAPEIQSYRLRTLGVAHTKGVPFFIKGKLKGVFREQYGWPILLDWDGDFARAFACTEKTCNLLVFDEKGAFVQCWSVTDENPDLLTEIVRVVRGLVAAPRGGSGAGATQ